MGVKRTADGHSPPYDAQKAEFYSKNNAIFAKIYVNFINDL